MFYINICTLLYVSERLRNNLNIHHLMKWINKFGDANNGLLLIHKKEQHTDTDITLP